MNIYLVFSYSVAALLILFDSVNGVSFQERAKKYCRLDKTCQHREVKEFNYPELIKLSDIPGIQPKGYLVRIPLFVLAQRDAYIAFAWSEQRSWTLDHYYEILIGGHQNNRTIIRRKTADVDENQVGNDIATSHTPRVLRGDEPVKLIIEISTAGDIRVLSEYQSEPLAVAKDSNPLPIKYIGFKSKSNVAKFFFDCEGENEYGEDDLKSMCQYEEALEYDFLNFHKISDLNNAQPSGYLLNFLFFLQAESDARVRLTTIPEWSLDYDEYDLLFGGWGNSRSVIRRTQGSSDLRDLPNQQVLTKDKFIAFLIQITTDGEIRLFRKEGLAAFKLLGEANDARPLPIKYVGFGSFNNQLAKFYFNCSFSYSNPISSVATGNLLVNDKIPPTITLNNYLITQCRYYTSNGYTFDKFVDIRTIRKASTEGYVLRTVFYVQGGPKAYILLSASDNEDDLAYEIEIGALTNQLVFRQRTNSTILGEAYEAKVFTNARPGKLLLEVSSEGKMLLYSQTKRSEPLLTVDEKNLIYARFISFAGSDDYRTQFFYDCNHINYN